MKKLIDRIILNRYRKGFLLALALVVTFISTYTLVLPAITLEKNVASSTPGVDLNGSDSREETSVSDDESGSATVEG